RKSALSRSRRHGGRGSGDGPRRSRGPRRGRGGLREVDRASARMGRRPAERGRRLGGVRRRQRPSLSQQYPVRRSWRSARSAERRRHCTLRFDAGATRRKARSERGIEALLRFQEKDGSWFGRWGMNYIYGSWSALCALHAVGTDPKAEPVRRSVDWLVGIQNPDGGWGESAESYRLDYEDFERAASTASQTAWALLGLM